MHIFIHESSRSGPKSLTALCQLKNDCGMSCEDYRHQDVLTAPEWQLVNTSSLDDHDFFPSSWPSSFVGALHLSAFESLRIGKSPNSCVYENTSFQEPAVNLYLVQAAQCISLPGRVPLRKLSMEVCPPPCFHGADWLIFSLMTSCVGHGLGLQERIGHAGPVLFCYAHLRCCKVRHLPFLWPERMTCAIIKKNWLQWKVSLGSS